MNFELKSLTLYFKNLYLLCAYLILMILILTFTLCLIRIMCNKLIRYAYIVWYIFMYISNYKFHLLVEMDCNFQLAIFTCQEKYFNLSLLTLFLSCFLFLAVSTQLLCSFLYLYIFNFNLTLLFLWLSLSHIVLLL